MKRLVAAIATISSATLAGCLPVHALSIEQTKAMLKALEGMSKSMLPKTEQGVTIYEVEAKDLMLISRGRTPYRRADFDAARIPAMKKGTEGVICAGQLGQIIREGHSVWRYEYIDPDGAPIATYEITSCP